MKTFITMVMLVLVTACTTSAFSQSTFLIRNQQEKFTKSLTTTGTTVTRIDSIGVASNETGLLVVTVIGYDESGPNSYVGRKSYTYLKAAGTLTVPAAAVDSFETNSGLSGVKFRCLSTAFNNTALYITGKSTTTIKWTSTTTQYLRRTD